MSVCVCVNVRGHVYICEGFVCMHICIHTLTFKIYTSFVQKTTYTRVEHGKKDILDIGKKSYQSKSKDVFK